MTSLIEFIIDLFRFPAVATSFVANPEQTMRDAGLTNVKSVHASAHQVVAQAQRPGGGQRGQR